VQNFKCEALPLLVSSSVTGSIAVALAVNANAVANFATRFGDLFEEYRIVKVEYRMKFFDSTAKGLLVSWVDEKNIGAPTLAESRTKSTGELTTNLSRVNRDLMLKWTPHDTVDLQYLDTLASPISIAALKLYSDSANYGTLASALPLFEVYQTYTMQFRGLR
jgi:hypothetical protein